jgi:hypothetical protein
MEERHFRFISAGDHLDINGWSELQSFEKGGHG